MASPKRRRQRANRRAAAAKLEPVVPPVTDLELEQLLADVTVRADCEHASTRATSDGLVLTRCAVGAAVLGGCPRGCESFERRHVGGVGGGAGSS